MRRIAGLIALLAVVPIGLTAQETQPKKEIQPKEEYAAFSRLIHRMVVKQLPKEFADDSGWGQRIEVPPRLPFPRLRTVFKVGDHLEAPHGAWRRFKGKIENPNQNLKIVVTDFKKRTDKTYRVVVDVDATLMVHGEWQQWQKGLLLVGAEAIADANVTAAIVCDVDVALNFSKFPPELKIEPKIEQLGLNFVDFKIRGGPFIQGDFGDKLRTDLKDGIRGLLKASEPTLKAEANRAIAESLKEGKGAISAGAMLKALPKSK